MQCYLDAMVPEAPDLSRGILRAEIAVWVAGKSQKAIALRPKPAAPGGGWQVKERPTWKLAAPPLLASTIDVQRVTLYA